MLQKLFGWLAVSNRPKHIKAAILIFVCMLASSFILELITTNRIIIDSVLSALAVLIGLMTVEYIQKRMGAKWDNLDIAAGMIFVLLILTVIISLTLVIN